MGRVESEKVDTDLLVPKKTKIVKYRDKAGKEWDGLYINQASGIFYARKSIKGRSHFLSLQTTSFMTAKSKLLDTLSEASNTTHLQPWKRKIFKDYYQIMYDEKVAKQMTEGTLKNIDRVWRHSLRDFWENVKPEDINQDLVSKYYVWFKRKKPHHTMFNQIKYLSNIFSVMVREGALQAYNVPELSMTREDQKKYDKQKGRVISQSEISRILQFCDERLRLMVMIAYSTGMRKGEICKLKKSDLKLNGNHYVIMLETDATKTGRARNIPLYAGLTPILSEWISTKGKYVFPSSTNVNRPIYTQIVDRDWTNAKKLAGISGRMRFHDLRHTAATNLVKQGINPGIACDMLGMSLRIFQKVYLKLSSDDLIIASDALGRLMFNNEAHKEKID